MLFVLKNNKFNLEILKKAKRLGFADSYLAEIWDTNEIEIYNLRKENR